VGYIIHSHNLLFNVAVEQGLLGVFALLWMWGVLGKMLHARSAAPMAGPEPDASRRDGTTALAVAVLCLVVVAVHGMVDDVLYGSRAVLLLFLPLGFGIRSTRSHTSGRGSRAWSPHARFLVPASLTVILVFALLWRKPLLSFVYGNLGAVHQSQAELSVYSWPDWPLQDEVRRSIDLSRPISEFERALVLDPRNATAHRRLGMIDLSMGRYEQALPHLEAAYVAEPSSDVTRSLLGEAYVANGRLAEGLILLSSVGDSGGRLAARVFWYGYIGDEERQEWMRQAMPVP